MPLLKNLRFYVLIFSLFLSLGIFAYVKTFIPPGTLQTIRLTQIYALTALAYLYLALLATPLTKLFPQLPYRGHYIFARRAIGVSTFYFATLHASVAFWGQLGGFRGLPFLSDRYLLAISLSFTAWIILLTMATTSFDIAIRKLSFPTWKLLHRLVYIAAVLTLIHALMLGTHFQNLSSLIPQIIFIAVSTLLLLEANRFDSYLNLQWPTLPKFGLTFTILTSLVVTFLAYTAVPAGSLPSLSVHQQHLQIARQNQANSNSTGNSQYLSGDPTRRYSVSFSHSPEPQSNQEIQLDFTITQASNGSNILLFDYLNEQLAHLIIVDNQLNYYQHLHPEQTRAGFKININLPHDELYHLYIDFKPAGAIEQQFAFVLPVGTNIPATTPNFQPDLGTSKVFNQYQVSLTGPQPLTSSAMSLGQQLLTFTLTNTQTQQPATNLKPYLAAFGHLVLINQQTYDYIHIHPADLTPPQPDANGGPTVEFMPLGLYGPIKPGIYRAFAQFNPDNQLFTSDFTIEIKP